MTVSEIALRGYATPVVRELLAAESFGSESVDLPGLAELAAGSPVSGSPSLVVHGHSSRFWLACQVAKSRAP